MDRKDRTEVPDLDADMVRYDIDGQLNVGVGVEDGVRDHLAARELGRIGPLRLAGLEKGGPDDLPGHPGAGRFTGERGREPAPAARDGGVHSR